MSTVSAINSSIEKYGVDVVISTDDKIVNTKAFIEPLRYKQRIYVGGSYHRVGKTEKYIYIGHPLHPLVEDVTIIKQQSERYLVKHCEVYTVGDSPMYIWAIIERVGESE